MGIFNSIAIDALFIDDACTQLDTFSAHSYEWESLTLGLSTTLDSMTIDSVKALLAHEARMTFLYGEQLLAPLF
ncbi:hypothetical protein SAY87_021107 [Trapa incisa]|uniref:Uncharacterized protein n=1 Tax=Trapa incisa TaxID=236973 RepID=A0AAN7JR53_9MYRT|nr:hypothetical protein SAY87_021107 [Trapa incisa]